MGSKRSWDELREYAQVKGIAIFALKFARGGYPTTGGAFLEKPLMSVCELSGGIVMRMSKPAALSKSLERFVTMLLERYIVEFPRPANSTAGQHGLEVKIDKGVYIIIRPSGMSAALPDPALMADPSTIQAGPSQTPEQGTRKPVTKPQ